MMNPRPIDARVPGAFRLSLHEKIDICRGLFAALVVVAHSLEIAWGVHPAAKEAMPFWVHEYVVGAFGTGTYYVMGFFVLSGYCIHMSVARSMEEEHFPARRYVFARLSRVLPLYYLGLLATLAVEWAISDARPWEWPNGLNLPTFLAQIFMIQNLSQTFGSYASSWSMTNEVFYYLLYGALAYFFAGRSSRPAWVGMGICIAAAMVTQVLYVTIGRNPVVYSTGMLLGLGMLWFQGALVAIHGKEWVKIPWVRRLSRFWPLVLATAIAWKTFHLTPHGLYLISGWAFTLMMLSFVASAEGEEPAPVGRWREGIITALGLASYPMYLFHGQVGMLIGSWILRTGAISDWRITWAIILVAGLVSGAALGWWVERPVMTWRAGMLRRMRENGSRQPIPRPLGARRSAPANVIANS